MGEQCTFQHPVDKKGAGGVQMPTPRVSILPPPTVIFCFYFAFFEFLMHSLFLFCFLWNKRNEKNKSAFIFIAEGKGYFNF
jgi:hypothetical protein